MLGMVVTSPRHRSSGAASLPLIGAIDKAIECGVEFYLKSSLSGRPLCASSGYQLSRSSTLTWLSCAARAHRYTYLHDEAPKPTRKIRSTLRIPAGQGLPQRALRIQDSEQEKTWVMCLLEAT